MSRQIGILILLLTTLTWADTVGELEAKVQSVLPIAKERAWSDIPWRIDLNRARREAVAAKKPIFVWIMDGHVLAAT